MDSMTSYSSINMFWLDFAVARAACEGHGGSIRDFEDVQTWHVLVER